MPWEIRLITEESASVVASPMSRPSATSLSSRRMIFPERVLGSSGTIMIWRGLAIGPISLATWLRSAWMVASPSSAASPRRMTNAHTAWPVVSSAAPTTAASATDGCDTRADSISAVESRWPETFMTSSTRPSSQMLPLASYLAPSPAK